MLVVRTVFSEVLELSESVVGDESFFELGGDSIQALQVRSDIRSRLDVDIYMDEFFDHATPSRLARLVAARTGHERA